MFQKLSELKDLVAQSSICRKLALAVSQDEHSLEAVHAAYKAGFITPILIGSRVATEKIIADKGLDFTGAEFVDEQNPIKAVELAVRMVHDHKADILMKGKVATPDLLRGR